MNDVPHTSLPVANPCAHQKQCPISQTPCPGECIFADIVGSVGLGIVIFDVRARTLMFVNRWALEDLERAGVRVRYDELERLLLTSGDPKPDSLGRPQHQQLRFGDTLLGYTVYRVRDFSWVFLRDITEKARLESIAEAVETTNNIGYIFSAVRHELGNPINSIKVALGVLEDNLDTFSRDTIAEYVTRMSTELGRVERLLRALRSYSLFEQPRAAAVDVTALLAEFCDLVRPELEARGIALEHRLDVPVSAACDPRALHQVLLNLVTNATDAVAGCERPRIVVSAVAAEAGSVIRVEDNGRGISDEQKALLFKPFNTSKPHGTGLGLVIVRKLLAAMDATIAIDSVQAVGTTVSISMPAAPRAEVTAA